MGANPWTSRLAAVLLAGIFPCPAAVQLTLRIPPAETYVVGDDIPLYWRFHNASPSPLGFMWEGCCRLNGQLEVHALDRPLPTQPPGQALAHMFAKADRLDPGIPKEYDTRVSDWVQLPGTGTYRLRGTYRGVLPSQQPQVARGLALWRDAAQSPPVDLRVLSVGDYLAQSEDRTRRRGIRVRLEGPNRLPPLGTASFRVTLENLEPREHTLRWPDDAALWILNSQQQRAARAAVLDATTEILRLPARGAIAREFTLPASRFEGEPLADYQVFVDLSEIGPDQPRVPSNRLPLTWRLDPPDVARLINDAAAGGRTGAQNAPLKLLRVYLLDLAPILTRLDRAPFPTKSRDLLDRLDLAAHLKPAHPVPGPVELTLDAPASGAWRWRPLLLDQALRAAHPTFEAQFNALLAARRDLGWEIGLTLEPAPDTPLHVLASATRALEPHAHDLSHAPRLRLLPAPASAAATNAPVTPGPSAANLPPQGPFVELALSQDESLPTLRVAFPTGSDAAMQWAPDGRTFEPLPSPAALLDRLAAGSRPNRWQIDADPRLTWDRLRFILAQVSSPDTTWVWRPR